MEVTNPSAPAVPAYADITILDPDDDFPDGSYELVIGEQFERILKQNGKYKGRP